MGNRAQGFQKTTTHLEEWREGGPSSPPFCHYIDRGLNGVTTTEVAIFQTSDRGTQNGSLSCVGFSYSSSFFSLLIQRREINCWTRQSVRLSVSVRRDGVAKDREQFHVIACGRDLSPSKAFPSITSQPHSHHQKASVSILSVVRKILAAGLTRHITTPPKKNVLPHSSSIRIS